MKFIFLVGGFVGFVLTAAAGLGAGREAALVWRDAAIGCLAGAFLFRWFWAKVLNALTETVERRRRDAQAAAEAKPAAAPTPAPRAR